MDSLEMEAAHQLLKFRLPISGRPFKEISRPLKVRSYHLPTAGKPRSSKKPLELPSHSSRE